MKNSLSTYPYASVSVLPPANWAKQYTGLTLYSFVMKSLLMLYYTVDSSTKPTVLCCRYCTLPYCTVMCCMCNLWGKNLVQENCETDQVLCWFIEPETASVKTEVETIRNFFSYRVVEARNSIPIRTQRPCTRFKKLTEHTEQTWWGAELPIKILKWRIRAPHQEDDNF